MATKITRDLIKIEIDRVEDEYLPALYRVVKAFEPPVSANPADSDEDWRTFIASTYGSTAATPLERGEQGGYEVRDPLE